MAKTLYEIFKPMIILSAPAKSGYTQSFESTEQARVAAARLLDVAVTSMVEVEINGTVYCYASQAEADADTDGAYAVQYSEAE